MAPSVSTRRCRAGLVPLAFAAAASWASLRTASAPLGAAEAFSATAGMTRKQQRSQLHTRGNLPPQVQEIPLEAEPEELEPQAPTPQKRVPYTLHMVTQFPNHKQLSEDGSARQYLQSKLVGALDHVEDMLKHVELQLRVEEHFHKEKQGRKTMVQPETETTEMADGSIVEDVRSDFGSNGAKVLAPYQIKVVVSMKNGKEIVYSNPEKHAEQSLTEAADGMADGLRRLLREEKEKSILARRHAKDADAVEIDTFEEEAIDTIGAAEDAEAEAIYAAVEATRD